MAKNIQLYIGCNQYYPGETMTGQVVCQFKNAEDIRKIRVTFEGSEYTKWTEGSGRNSTTYTGTRKILSLEKIIHNGGKVGAGEYSFEFEFVIPKKIPSSFEHKKGNTKGNIRYSVKATVDRPWAFDYEKKGEVIIASLIKLQDISPSLQNPGILSDEKNICCFCCVGGNIELDIMLEKRVFNIGENFYFVASCKNRSNNRVRALEVLLELKLTFRAPTMLFGDAETTAIKTISSASYDGVEAHSEITTQLGFLVPPSIMVPNFTGATLFSSEPRLVFKAVIPGCHLDLILEAKAGLYHVPPLAPPVVAQYEQPEPSCPPISMRMPYCLQEIASISQEIGVPPSKSTDHIGIFAPPPTYEEANKN